MKVFINYALIVSVPIRGLFNLTLSSKQQIFTGSKIPKTAEIVNPLRKALYRAKIMSFNRATITTAQIYFSKD